MIQRLWTNLWAASRCFCGSVPGPRVDLAGLCWAAVVPVVVAEVGHKARQSLKQPSFTSDCTLHCGLICVVGPALLMLADNLQMRSDEFRG